MRTLRSVVAMVGLTVVAAAPLAAQQDQGFTEEEQEIVDALQSDLSAFGRGEDVPGVEGPLSRAEELTALREHPLFRCGDCAAYFWDRITAALDDLPRWRVTGISLGFSGFVPVLMVHWELVEPASA